MSSGPYGIGKLSTTRDLVIHWSVNGNDNGSGDFSSPLLTAGAVLDRLPKILTNDVTIRVIGHHTQSLIITDRLVLGTLTIAGHSGNRTTNGIGDLIMQNVHGVTRTVGLTINSNDDSTAMLYEYCGGHHYVDNVISEKPLPDGVVDYTQYTGNIDQGRGLMALWGSHVSVYNSRFSGRRYGVRASYGGASLEVRNCDGTNNAIGAGARFGGTVTIYDGCPSGNIARLSSISSGKIIEGGLVLVNADTPAG